MSKLAGFIKTYWILISVILLSSITILSLWPAADLPAVPGSDKIHHFIAYAFLMFPVALRKPRYWLVYGIFFILWSGCIELIQPYVNRYGEWLDLAANSMGLIFGMLAARLVDLALPSSKP